MKQEALESFVEFLRDRGGEITSGEISLFYEEYPHFQRLIRKMKITNFLRRYGKEQVEVEITNNSSVIIRLAPQKPDYKKVINDLVEFVSDRGGIVSSGTISHFYKLYPEHNTVIRATSFSTFVKKYGSEQLTEIRSNSNLSIQLKNFNKPPTVPSTVPSSVPSTVPPTVPSSVPSTVPLSTWRSRRRRNWYGIQGTKLRGEKQKTGTTQYLNKLKRYPILYHYKKYFLENQTIETVPLRNFLLLQLQKVIPLPPLTKINPCTLLSENFEVYTNLCRHLLYIEELEARIEMSSYDMQKAEVTPDVYQNTAYRVSVPGLAEGRPSILRGDKLTLLRDGVKYIGYVLFVNLDWIVISLHSKFPRHSFGVFADIHFHLSRPPYKLQHRSLEMANKYLRNRFDIRQIESENVKNVFEKTINERVKTIQFCGLQLNEHQKKAVATILLTSPQQPAIIFGYSFFCFI
jgi:hypothetical protein